MASSSTTIVSYRKSCASCADARADAIERNHMPSVLVTGAGRGIGLAITRHMSERGWDVYATARSADDLRDLGRLSHVHRLQLDITDRSAVAKLSEQLPARLDGVVNNAARGRSPEGREGRRSGADVPASEASLPVRQHQPSPTGAAGRDSDRRQRCGVRSRHHFEVRPQMPLPAVQTSSRRRLQWTLAALAAIPLASASREIARGPAGVPGGSRP